LAIQATSVPFTILRTLVVYGPHVKGNLKTVVRLALSPLPLPFAGFNSRRSLPGIDNLISAILFVLNIPETLNETYLVADAEPVSIRDPSRCFARRRDVGRCSSTFRGRFFRAY
jgi:nucleoside-diphosphate-sugar epimerase